MHSLHNYLPSFVLGLGHVNKEQVQFIPSWSLLSSLRRQWAVFLVIFRSVYILKTWEDLHFQGTEKESGFLGVLGYISLLSEVKGNGYLSFLLCSRGLMAQGTSPFRCQSPQHPSFGSPHFPRDSSSWQLNQALSQACKPQSTVRPPSFAKPHAKFSK